MTEEFSEPTLELEAMASRLKDAFRWAAKNCIEATGLPEYPIVRNSPYEGEQELPMYIKYRGGGLYVKGSVTMRISKARKKRDEPSDFDTAIAQLNSMAAQNCAPYFVQAGNTIGACNYPAENAKHFVGLYWNDYIIKMAFRASTFVGPWTEPDFPYDPMDPGPI